MTELQAEDFLLIAEKIFVVGRLLLCLAGLIFGGICYLSYKQGRNG